MIRRTCILLLALTGSCSAAEQWLRISTPHFDLVTNETEKAGRDLIGYFEQVRGFFLKVTPVRIPDEFPVRLIAFKDKEQFAAYAPRVLTRAYFLGSPLGEYIVMADVTPESYGLAVHEYTHLIVRHSGLKIPVWLNEGWADVYSSMHAVKDGVAVGDLLPGRMRLLEGPWLDFATLTSVTAQSPIYNEGDRTGIFYGESWALVHMLFLSPEYKQNFPKFVNALNRGSTTAEACQAAYGKSSDDVFRDLRAYFARKKLYGTVFQTTLGKAETEPVIAPLTGFDAQLALADLQTALGRYDIAAREYDELGKLQPGRPDVMQSQGYLALLQKDVPLALASLRKAYEAGSQDPRMCVALAQMETGRQPPAKIIPILERAVKVKPDFTDALLQLGALRVADRQYEAGISALMSIQTIAPERAPAVFFALSYAYLQTGDLDRARQNIETAKKWARAPEDSQRLTQLSSLLEARAKLPVPPRPGEKLVTAEGLVQAVDCGSGGSRMHFQSGERSMVFVMPDPKAIEFTSGSGPTLQIPCGPQQKPFHVRLDYAPASVMEQGPAGVIRRLDY